MKQKKQWIGYLYLLPMIILVVTFLLYPFITGLVLSFFSTKYGFGDMSFAGFNNYIKILQNELFGIALKNSLIWVLVGLVINSVIPMALALLLNREFRGKSIALGAMLIPWLTPVVGFAMMSKWLLEPEMGVVNIFLKNIGLINKGINFIGSHELAFPTVILLNFLQFCPFGVLLMLSALSVIPKEQYEAMQVDGANKFQIFRSLIMPSVGTMTGFMLFLGVVWTFSNYSLIYIMTKGGPSHSTYTIPIMIYEKAFTEFNVGQSTALATMTGLFLIIGGYFYTKKIYKPIES